jgi:hypothetical protein
MKKIVFNIKYEEKNEKNKSTVLFEASLFFYALVFFGLAAVHTHARWGEGRGARFYSFGVSSRVYKAYYAYFVKLMRNIRYYTSGKYGVYIRFIFGATYMIIFLLIMLFELILYHAYIYIFIIYIQTSRYIHNKIYIHIHNDRLHK